MPLFFLSAFGGGWIGVGYRFQHLLRDRNLAAVEGSAGLLGQVQADVSDAFSPILGFELRSGMVPYGIDTVANALGDAPITTIPALGSWTFHYLPRSGRLYLNLERPEPRIEGWDLEVLTAVYQSDRLRGQEATSSLPVEVRVRLGEAADSSAFRALLEVAAGWSRGFVQ